MHSRELTSSERAVLELLLTHEFPGRDELLVQARTVRTTGSSCTCGCPSFSLHPDRKLREAGVTSRMPTDAHGSDPGGNEIGVLLFVDDGYLSEVEVYGYRDSDFAGLPEAGALKLSHWSDADENGTSHLLNP